MVEILDKPPKKIFVGEHIFYNESDDLVKNLVIAAAAGQPVALLWAGGIVFIPSPAFSESELMVQKYLDGEVHWASVSFASMDEYQAQIRIKGLEIPVIDASRSKTMREVAKWLKGSMKK